MSSKYKTIKYKKNKLSNTDDLVSGFAENDVFQSEADSILDFSEKNPFGVP